MLAQLRHSPRLYQEQWRAAAMPRLERLVAESTADSAHLRLLLETLDWGTPRPDLAAALLRHRVVRRDSALLFRLYSLRDTAYRDVRRPAVDAMLALPTAPERLWLESPWWQTHPQLIRDRRVRSRREVLVRMRYLSDPFRFADLQAEAARLLLADSSLDAETVVDIALQAGGNARRCRPRAFPVREIAMAALDHPRAREDDRVAQALVYIRGEEEVRERAYRRLTGQSLPERSRVAQPRVDPVPLLMQAHAIAMTRLITLEGALDTVSAQLARWDSTGRHPAESRAWRALIAANPDPDSLGRILMRRTPEMNRLRSASPFLSLLTPQERDEMGVGCDLLPEAPAASR
jgi:hypothetical protein